MTKINDEQFFTVLQVSKMLGIHKQRIYSAIKEGELDAYLIGNRKSLTRISSSQLKSWMNFGKNDVEEQR